MTRYDVQANSNDLKRTDAPEYKQYKYEASKDETSKDTMSCGKAVADSIKFIFMHAIYEDGAV